jgi:hypothetical protein
VPNEYIEVPVEFDETALYNMAVAKVQETFPEWVPKPASTIDIVFRAGATMAAVGAEVASDVPANIFRAFGDMAGAPSLDAVSATVILTFKAIDTKGYTVPVQTPVGMTSPSTTDTVGFWTLNEADIPAGQQSLDILCVAVIPGANGSNLFQVVRTDSLSFINGIVMSPSNTVSQGGQDAELDDAFDTRLAQEFETWTETPILGKNFAVLSRKVNGVYRCGYIDNYNPVDQTTDNDKMVALCPIDADGNDVSTELQQEVAALMESWREMNFICNVMGATRSLIDVSYTGHVNDPTNVAQATSDVQAALAAYLNQASWGIQQTQTGEVPVWENDPNIRYSKIMTTIESVPTLDWAELVTIGIQAGTMGTTDIVMPGAFTLPNLGVVTANVVSP